MYKNIRLLTPNEETFWKERLQVPPNTSLSMFVNNLRTLELQFSKMQVAMVIRGTGLKGSTSHFKNHRQLQDQLSYFDNEEDEFYVAPEEEERRQKPRKKRGRKRRRGRKKSEE